MLEPRAWIGFGLSINLSDGGRGVYVDTYVCIAVFILSLPCLASLAIDPFYLKWKRPFFCSHPSIHPSIIHVIYISKIQNRNIPLLIPIPSRLRPPVPPPAAVTTNIIIFVSRMLMMQRHILDRARPPHERGLRPRGAHEREPEWHPCRRADACGKRDHRVACCE